MEIVIIVHDDIKKLNGTTIRIKHIISLIGNQYSITLITSSASNSNHGVYEGVKTINIDSSPKWTFISKMPPTLLKLITITKWNIKLAFFIVETKVDVVYCAHDWVGFITLYVLSKIRKYRLIFEAHSIYSEEYKEMGYSGLGLRIRRMIEKFVIQHSDQVIALSSNTFNFYQRYNTKIELIPVFVDQKLFYRSNPKPKSDNLRLIGLIGPFDDIRKQASLKFLYANINNFDNRLRFLVIGHCDEKMKIQNERIIYAGYLASYIDYIHQLWELDTVLVAENIATLGPLNKIIEPMACGISVFTTPKGMVGLYCVKPGRDIFVFEEDSMVDKINKLVFDDDLIQMVGANASKVVELYYSRKTNAKKLMEIIEKVGRDQNAQLS